MRFLNCPSATQGTGVRKLAVVVKANKSRKAAVSVSVHCCLLLEVISCMKDVFTVLSVVRKHFRC